MKEKNTRVFLNVLLHKHSFERGQIFPSNMSELWRTNGYWSEGEGHYSANVLQDSLSVLQRF